jgi:hypothetical protein
MRYLYIYLLICGLVFKLINDSYGIVDLFPDLFCMVVIASGTVILFLTLINSSIEKYCFFIIFAGYFVRFLFLMFDIYGRVYFLLPNSGYDTEYFNIFAIDFALNDVPTSGYTLFVGYLYKFFGIHSRLIAQYFNVVFSITVIVIANKILCELEVGKRTKIVSLSILAFLPNYIILSVILLRESLLILLLSISLLFFVRWWKNNSSANFYISLIFGMFAAVLHSGVISNSIAYVIIFILYNNRQRIIRVNIKTMLASTLFLGLFLFIYFQYSDLFFRYFGGLDSIEDISKKLSGYQNGGSAYLVETRGINSIYDLIVLTPIRMFYFLTSPVPWQWRGISDVVAFLFSTLFFIISSLYAIKALKLKNKNKGILVLGLLLIMFSSIIFGWGTSNSGTAIRHRDKFVVNYIVVLAISMDILNRNRSSPIKIKL